MVCCCLSIVPSGGDLKRVNWRLLVKERIDKVSILRTVFLKVLMIVGVFNLFLFFWFGFLSNSLLCIVGELARGGSVADAVCDM